MQSIHQHYSEDHDRLDELFHRFQQLKPTDRNGALEAFREFKTGLERHIVWEEEILFPSFEQKFRQVGGPTAVMRREHQEIRKCLDAIAGKLAHSDFDTEADEKGLLSLLRPHNQKEEEILYPMIDQATGPQERTEIFAEMVRRG